MTLVTSLNLSPFDKSGLKLQYDMQINFFEQEKEHPPYLTEPSKFSKMQNGPACDWWLMLV